MVHLMRFAAIMAAVLLAVSPASAQVASNGGSGLYNVEKAGTLGHMVFGIGGLYTYDNFGRHGLDVDETAQNVSFTLGLGDSFELSANLKNASYERTGRMDIETIFPTLRVLENGEATVDGLLDGVVRGKWNFLSSATHNIDISAQLILSLPLGDEEIGLGIGETAFGGQLLLDKNYADITWSFNLGYMNLDFPDNGLSPLYTAGVGFEYFPTNNLSVLAEVSGYAWDDVNPRRDDAVRTSWGARYYISHWGSLNLGYAAWSSGQEPQYLYTGGITFIIGGKGRPEHGELPPGPDGPAVTIVLESVHFAFDSSALTAKAKDALAVNAQRLNENPEAGFVIEGNTCSIGTKGYNYQLGLRRAIAAKKFLIEQGVNADRMMIISYGEERPKHDNSTREGRQQNRRVDFVIEVK